MGLSEGAMRKDGSPARKPGKVPTKIKKPAVFKKGVERPHVWLVGTDKYKHDMYHPWQMAKAQANYRLREGLEEGGWDMTFDEWYDLWKDHWNERGRLGHQKCITRKDFEKAWSKDNCEIVERHEHLKRTGKHQREIREQMQLRLNIRYRKMQQYKAGKK